MFSQRCREHLQQYLTTTSPVAVTKHGETIGFYIPARHQHPDKLQLAALKQAAEDLERSQITYRGIFSVIKFFF